MLIFSGRDKASRANPGIICYMMLARAASSGAPRVWRTRHFAFARRLILSIAVCLAALPAEATAGEPTVVVAKHKLIDINRASAEELKSLPGIADAYAFQIARHRPYQNKAQLLSRGVIPVATYKKIKNQIVARQ